MSEIQPSEEYILNAWMEEGYINDDNIKNFLPHVQEWYYKQKEKYETSVRY